MFLAHILALSAPGPSPDAVWVRRRVCGPPICCRPADLYHRALPAVISQPARPPTDFTHWALRHRLEAEFSYEGRAFQEKDPGEDNAHSWAVTTPVCTHSTIPLWQCGSITGPNFLNAKWHVG
ncbi:unnamed protein product [Arctogadus glacialis]